MQNASESDETSVKIPRAFGNGRIRMWVFRGIGIGALATGAWMANITWAGAQTAFEVREIVNRMNASLFDAHGDLTVIRRAELEREAARITAIELQQEAVNSSLCYTCFVAAGARYSRKHCPICPIGFGPETEP